LNEIPAGTLAEWIEMYSTRPTAKLSPCQGRDAEGKMCSHPLTARARYRPCPKCGHTNWKEAQADAAKKKEAANATDAEK
jgi:hypothetical protein